MKKHTAILVLAALTPCLLVGAPKDEVTAAAKSLADKPNYSWKTTVAVPEGTQFRPGPTEGMTEKGGCTCLKMTFRETPMTAVMKGDKMAMTDQDGNWVAVAESDDGQGPGRFMARMLRNQKNPAEQAVELAGAVGEWKKEGEDYVGELSPDGAKAQFRWGDVSGPKGSVKFWLKDGVLTKYEYRVQGKVSFNNNDMDVDRTTTVEIKDVGTTKLQVPEAAKQKLS